MLEFDLDEVAEAFFSVRTGEKPEFQRLLIRAGNKAVMPLLHALLGVTAKYQHYTNDIARKFKRGIFGEESGRYFWAKVTFESEVKNSYDIIRRIGQPAKDELCRALMDRDYRIRLSAALLLALDEEPSSETYYGTQRSLNYLADPSQSLILMLLGIVFLRAGDTKWLALTENHARETGISLQEWVERTINTALIELQRGR